MPIIDQFQTFNQLHEGLSAQVFHYTGIQNIVAILKEDRMKAASAMANDSDGGQANRNQHFYISFQRGKHSGVGYAGKTHESCCILFDGAKLNQKYRSTPIEYNIKPRHLKGAPPKYDPKDVPTKDELEDRIAMPTPFLDNVRRYVLEIHIYVSGMVNRHYTELQKICTTLAIPLYFYGVEKDYLFKRKERAQPLDAFGYKDVETPSTDEWNERMNTQEIAVHKLLWIVPLYIHEDPSNKAKLEALFDPEYHNDTHEGLYYRVQNFEHRLYYREEMESQKRDYFYQVRSLRQSHNPWVLDFAKLLAKDFRRYKALYASDYYELKLGQVNRKKALDAAKPAPLVYVTYEQGNQRYICNDDPLNYNYYAEELEEHLTKFLQGRGKDDVAVLVARFDELKMGDLLTLLKKYVKPRGIEKWFLRIDMVPMTEEGYKTSPRSADKGHW